MKLLPVTKPQFRSVVIEEDFVERKGKVYWKYRFNGQGKWYYRLTPYDKIPWVRVI